MNRRDVSNGAKGAHGTPYAVSRTLVYNDERRAWEPEFEYKIISSRKEGVHGTPYN